ncbi:hypothetical protein [Paenibacillus arenilitoris]|nr:hypothetical protein [Paenibacillus arenilitoris]
MKDVLWPWGAQMFVHYPWVVSMAFGAAALLLSCLTWIRWNKK